MKRKSRRVTALSVFGLMLFGPPLIVAVNRQATVAGWPLVPLYIFGAWTLVVVLAFIIDLKS
jgi:hypothetical protein